MAALSCNDNFNWPPPAPCGGLVRQCDQTMAIAATAVVHPPAGHTVCVLCENQSLATAAVTGLIAATRMESPPGPPNATAIAAGVLTPFVPAPLVPAPLAPIAVAVAGGVTWPGFLSRMCTACEKYEQKVCELRLSFLGVVGDTPAPAAPNPGAGQAGLPAAYQVPAADYGEWYPLDNCTCRPRIMEELCNAHRQELVTGLKNRMRANSDWLRTLDVVPLKGQGLPCTANALRIQSRVARGTYRACRCGSEVDIGPNRVFEVLFCMSCAKTYHVVEPRFSRHDLTKIRPNPVLPRDVTLGRARSRKTCGHAMSVND